MHCYYYYYYAPTHIVRTESEPLIAAWWQDERHNSDEGQETTWYEHIHDVVKRFSSNAKRERDPRKDVVRHFN